MAIYRRRSAFNRWKSKRASNRENASSPVYSQVRLEHLATVHTGK